MAEILLGTTIKVWSGSSTVGGRAAFGPSGSLIVVVITMVLLAVALGIVAFEAGLGRLAPFVGVAAVWLARAGLGAVALAALIDDLGIAILLAFAWILTVPVRTRRSVAGQITARRPTDRRACPTPTAPTAFHGFNVTLDERG